MKKILILTRKPHSASFEQRILNYLPALSALDFAFEQQLIPSSLNQQRKLFKLTNQYDLVWWHRHMPTPLSQLLLKRCATPIVFDYDDPILYSSKNGGQKSFARQFRFAQMIKRCHHIVTASKTLANFALAYHPQASQVHLVPMAITMPSLASNTLPNIQANTQAGVQADATQSVLGNKTNTQKVVELLWLGSLATQAYLELIRPALEKLGETHCHVRLRLVAHQPMLFGKLQVDYQKWSPAAQDAALQQCHIGLCPMLDTLWTRGKCPYKVLQYMAHAMPWVGSHVGENSIISNQEQCGLCASTTEQWYGQLARLVTHENLRLQIGKAAKQYILKNHDRQILVQKLSGILQEACI